MTDGSLAKPPRVVRPSPASPLAQLLSLLSLVSVLLLVGCSVLGPASFLSARDSEVKEATHAIETARDDAQRAKAYSARGTAYSEKARFSRILKLIPNDEYERLFNLAIKDHNQAVALAPANAEVYFNRAQAYYDRGGGDLVFHKDGSKSWFDSAALDFEKAVKMDPKNSLAFDRLGLAYEQGGEADKAIQAYTQEMALDRRLGRHRLATAYCYIGFEHQQHNELVAAAAAYQKSTDFGIADDKSCPYDPFGNSVAIFTTETREYDKAWDMVHRALKEGHLIAPELILRLKKESGRIN